MKNNIKLGKISQSIFIALCIISQVHFAYAQQGSIIPNGKATFLDQNGKPLTGGKVYFYTPNTTSPKTTYQDINQTIPNTNPVTLDAAGRALLWGIGSYRQQVFDKFNNLIWDVTTSTSGSGSSGPTGTGDGDAVGTTKPWPGATAPNQYMFTYGQTLNRTTYAPLFQAITSQQSIFCTSGNPTITGLSNTDSFWVGMTVELACVSGGVTTVVSKTAFTVTLAANANVNEQTTATFFMWGNGNGSTTFNLPDYRGLIPMGNNIMGGTASTNVTTALFGSQTPNSSGGQGGSSSSQLGLTNIPAGITSTSTQTVTVGAGGQSIPISTAPFVGGTSNTGGNATPISPGGSIAQTTTLSGSLNIAVTSNNTGSGGSAVAFSNIPASRTTNFIIKVTPDTAASGTGVTSLGGMAGDIACGSGLVCAGATISVANSFTLTVGVSPISGGTNPRVLYDNNGILGEYSVSGAGTTVALTNSPVFVTPTLGAAAGTSLVLSTALAVASGGTGNLTALGARSSSGLNIDEATSTGDNNYTILSTDRTIYHTALTAARTDTLPAASSVNAGQQLIIADPRGAATSSNTVTVQRAGSDTVNGSTSVTAINLAFGLAFCTSDGVSRWNCQPFGGGGGGGGFSSAAIIAGNGVSLSGTCSSSTSISCTVNTTNNFHTVRVVTASGAVTIANTDSVVVVNQTTPAAVAVNLFASPATGYSVTIKDGSCTAATFPLTITPAAGTIDNGTTLVMYINCQAVTLVYNGSKWNAI